MKKTTTILLSILFGIFPLLSFSQKQSPSLKKAQINNSKVEKKTKFIELTTTDIQNIGFIDAANFSIFGCHLGMTRKELVENLKSHTELVCDYHIDDRRNIDGLTYASISYINKQDNKSNLIMTVSWVKDQFYLSMIKLSPNIKSYLIGNSKQLFEYDINLKKIPSLNLLKGEPILTLLKNTSYFAYPENKLGFDFYYTKISSIEIKSQASNYEPLMPYKLVSKTIPLNYIQKLGVNEEADIDGNIYKTVEIGNQKWYSSNLNVTHFRNGDSILESKNMQDWYKADDEHKPSWCYYNYQSKYGTLYGKLYNKYAILDSRGLAPKGSHISLETEWQTLIKFLGGDRQSSLKLKSKTGWGEDINFNHPNGTDIFNFSALPGGLNLGSNGNSNDEPGDGNWWSISLEKNSVPIWQISSDSDDKITKKDFDNSYIGFSVRCVID